MTGALSVASLTQVAGSNSRIVYIRSDSHGNNLAYTTNPDGSDERLSSPEGRLGSLVTGRSQVDVRHSDSVAATIVDAETVRPTTCRSLTRLSRARQLRPRRSARTRTSAAPLGHPTARGSRVRRSRRRSKPQRHLHGSAHPTRRLDAGQFLFAGVCRRGRLLAGREATQPSSARIRTISHASSW